MRAGVAVCDRCGSEVAHWRDTTRNGRPAALGVDCGCVARWLHWRELWEYEVTGVIG